MSRTRLDLVFLLFVPLPSFGAAPETVDVFVPKTDGFASIRIPSVVVSKEGTVLAFAEGRAADADQAKNKLILKRSTDDGKTWGKVAVIAEDGDKALNNPCAVVEREGGQVLLVYQSYPAGVSERSGTIQTGYDGDKVVRNWLITSDDDGVTWSTPQDITRETKREKVVTTLAGGPGIGIQLRHGKHAGRILMPFNEGPFGVWNIYAVYSDDKGKTWQMGDAAPDGLIDDGKGKLTSTVNEAQFVELKDGSIRFNVRRWSGKAVRKSCVSEDGGKSWSKVEEAPNLTDPGCMGSVLRYTDPADGDKSRILFSGPQSTKRENGTVFVSYDEGKTWPTKRVLCKDSFAYSCLTALPDATIGCLYETGTKIVFARFTLNWLADGKDQLTQADSAPSQRYAEIRVLDAATGRGVPLVELVTVNSLTFVTDNAGRVAFHEPGLMDRELFFRVRSHGYEVKKDGLGIAGSRVTPKVGAVAEIKITRRNAAERLCRLTGEGLYRDSKLIGHSVPQENNGLVAGQDSVQAAVYQGKVFWFWGDTLRMDYPLGLFRMAGATTPTFDPKDPKSDPAAGIAFDYFVDKKTGFAREMMPLPERPEGVVWVGALAIMPDEKGADKLVAHYSRRKGLEGEFEQGIAVYDDARNIFEPVKQLPLTETWRRPSGHPIPFDEKGTKWLLFGSPTPNVRVPATLKDVLDPDQYEAFTCMKPGDKNEPDVGHDGAPVWRWQKKLPPMDSKTERELLKAGKIKPEHARFCPANAANPADRVLLHSGTVRWNAYRKRWVLVAGQLFGTRSTLGEVWYAEADHPTGPFLTAVLVVTHDKQTFYNVCHHAFLDRDGGRTIHFEGTYTNEFSGNPVKTPRYNYNQVLYRLDLDSPALKPARTTAAREFICPSQDNTHFVGATTGKRFVVWGVNYDRDDSGRLLEDYWEKEWGTVVEDFKEIQALGANIVRVHLQLAKFMDAADHANQENLERLGMLVRLAEETGLYLDVTGLGCYHKQDVPVWYDKLDEAGRWDAQEHFWKAVASMCKDNPAVFCYDLMNEPVFAGDHKDNEWLAAPLGNKYFVQRITRDLRGRSGEEVAKQWVKKLTDAIRKVDDRHMITVGVIPWAQVFKEAKPVFYAPGVGDPLDFVSVHLYPKAKKLDDDLAALMVYEIGKPLVIEEIFPLGCSIEEIETFIDKSATHCDGWVSFYWGKTIGEYEKEKDIKSALLAKWLRVFRAKGPSVLQAKHDAPPKT